jgi:hypothetical protein
MFVRTVQDLGFTVATPSDPTVNNPKPLQGIANEPAYLTKRRSKLLHNQRVETVFGLYIYIYIYVCVCVCVARARGPCT